VVLTLDSRVNQDNKSGGSTQINTSQCRDKNDCYHGFKTRLRSRLEEMFMSRVGRIDLADSKKKIIAA
jgi:predicted SPOUT superfamily RNA methylase MTH1